MAKNKKKKWICFRHRVTKWLFWLPFYIWAKLRYRVSLPRFKEQKGRQFLILMNHQTPFDQFFLSFTFRGPVYFVATEDIFSLGWISSLLRFFLAPIPIKKQTADLSAVMNCLRVAKEGGTIALAPEGNRTYTGRTEYMNPAIAGLARKLGLPIALYRIEGGYGVQPRWANTLRRGKMRAYVSEVIEPEEVKQMTDEELYSRICHGLFVDDTKEKGTYRHKRRAEFLERALYVCPYCGLSHLVSHRDTISCLKCGMEVEYTEHMTLVPRIGHREHHVDFPFRTVAEWYDHQCAYVGRRDSTPETDTPLYEDTVKLSEVIVYERKNLLAKQVRVSLYYNKLVLDGYGDAPTVLPFEEISAITVLGRTKINVYVDKRIYQLAGDERFCGLKYVNLHYRYINMNKETYDGKFLGL